METIVEILSRDLVKPSSPTPAHLREYKICLLDQLVPQYHGGIIFFYTNSDIIQPNSETNNNYYGRILKKSLSETLTDFHPIAGRFKDTSTIDCNDEGACVVEAKINSNLSDFLNNVSQSRYYPHDKLGNLVPKSDPITMDLASKCMLIAQLTVFQCGGTAICFCLEHRFCDLSSVVVFLKSWSARSRGGSAEIVLPDFVGSSFLPPRELPPLPAMQDLQNENRVMTRLVFEASKIADLKTRFIAESGESTAQINPYSNLSRVEVILALILKSAISATRSVTKSAKRSVIFQAVNLRKRTTPPLPENSIGNLVWVVPVTVEEEKIDFHELVRRMRSETTSFYDETVRKIKGDDEGSSLVFEYAKETEVMVKTAADVDIYWCSSWCRFPFYEVDFGWGKPVWVSSGPGSSSNFIVLQDTKCGSGVEAWVKLDPQIMAIFQRDEELLSFASLKPNIAVV